MRARIGCCGMALVACVGWVLVTPAPAAADYGTTPALQLPWPSGTSWTVSGFSYYYTSGCTSNGVYYPNDHQGRQAYALDFGLPSGSEVDAAAYGQVAKIAYDNAGGQYIWINHPSESNNVVQTYYGHLSTAAGGIKVSVNDYVLKGQMIALSDTSGSALGAHLHFNVTTGATDPFLTGSPYMPEPMSGLAPPGNTHWELYGCAGNSTQAFKSTSPDQQVTVARQPGTAEDLFVRGTTNDGWYSPTDANGLPLGWATMGGLIKSQPSAVWDSTGTRMDAFAIGTNDQVYHRYYLSTGGGWQGTWTSIGTTYTSAQSETEAVSATRNPVNGTMDLFFRGGSNNGTTVCFDLSHCPAIRVHTNATGTPDEWDNLGGYVKGAPSGRWDSTQSRLDIFAIGESDDLVWQLPYFTGRGWGQWQALNAEQASGQAESETISTVRRSDNTMDLFIRGTSGEGWQAHTDSGGIVQSWSWLGCCGIRGAPDAKWDANTSRLDVFVVGVDDLLYRKTWTSQGWGVWTLLGTAVSG